MKKILKITLTLILAIFSSISISACSCSNTDSELIVNTDSAKLVYDLSDDFSSDGIIVEMTSAKGSINKIVDYEIDASKFQKGIEGSYEIIVKYSKFEAKYNVEVREKGTLEITQNDKFFIGQDFKSNNPILTHITSSNVKTLISDYDVVSFDTSEVGEHSAQIKANGFEYVVNYEVIENLDYLNDLLTNVWLQTEENYVTTFQHAYYPEGYTDAAEVHLYAIAESGLKYFLDAYQYTAYYYEAWVDTNGLLIEQLNHGVPTKTQYTSQEEALEHMATGDVPTTPYAEYMKLVNLAQTGITYGTIDKIQTTEDGDQIEIVISSTYETITISYKLFYNATTKLVEKVEYYENARMAHSYEFNFNYQIPSIPVFE